MLRIGRFNKGITAVVTLLITQFSLTARAQTTNSSSKHDPHGHTHTGISPSVIVLLVIFSLVFVLAATTAVYIRYYTAFARSTVRSIDLYSIASLRASHGLDPAILATFPTFTYSEVKSQKIGKGALECAVCLNVFADEETLKLLPMCDHVFHADCIDVWLGSHFTCPVCRANLLREPEATETFQSGTEPSIVQSISEEAVLEPTNRHRSISVTIAPA